MLKKIISSMLIINILALWMPMQAFEEVSTSHAVTTSWEFNYTGNMQEFTAPYKAIYKVELYGAQGGNIDTTSGGKGSYVVGNITLNKNDKLSIYVGGQNGYNGGGSGDSYQAVGGGATDIRLGEDNVENRIIVAAGGGGCYKKPNYHVHTGSSSSGGGCYTQPNMVYGKTGEHTEIDYDAGYQHHPSCIDSGSGWGTDNDHVHCGYPTKIVEDYGWYQSGWNLGCGMNESTIVSYTNISGNGTSSSNSTLYQGSSGGGGGYYGGNTQYAGTNYASATYFSEVTTTQAQKTGNGLVTITLVTSYPEVNITANITANTNKDVILTANAKDDVIGLPTDAYSWNEEARTSVNTFVATKNGTYKVNVINNSGFTEEASYIVGNIDKIKPVVNSTSQTLSADKKSTKITIRANDYSSSDYIATGVTEYAITKEKIQPTEFTTANEIIVEENGTYYAWAKDAVGNVSEPKTVLVPNIEIEILGNITWNDQENKFSSRAVSNIKLYRRLEENGAETLVETQRLEPGQTSYSFQTRQCDDTGKEYIFRLEQELIDGYETLYTKNNITSNGTQNIEIGITNNLILPEYSSEIKVEPVNSFENKILKNSNVEITAVTQASTNNRESVGIHSGIVTIAVDDKIKIDKNNIVVTFEDGKGNTTNIDDFTIRKNTITTYFGSTEPGISMAGSKITIKINGVVTQIGDFVNTITTEGKLRDYRGTNTSIDLGIVTQNNKNFNVEYQIPEANIQIKKVDSITEQILTDATFDLYEWNGTEYIKKETLQDENKDGIYESKVYSWNSVTQGKYKIVEVGIPKYHKDLNFSMEYSLNELHAQNYIVTIDYDNNGYAIQYGKRTPDDFDKINGIVENEPWKLKAQIEKIDYETQNIIQSETEFTIYEWNKETNTYEEYTSYINGEKVDFIRQEDKTYITGEWLYYTPKNEGKYRIIETTAPQGYYANYTENNEKVVYDINILESIQNGEYQGQSVENESTIKIGNNSTHNKITNQRVDATLNVIVVDKETKNETQADATLKGAKYGLYALEEIKHADGITTRYENEPGVLYKKDELVEVQTTDEFGKMTFENLECGIYYVKMIEPPEGYLLDETKYKVDFSYQGETNKHIEITGQLELMVKKQAFQLYKLKENEQILSNAGFSIYLINDLSIVKEGKITKATSSTYYLNEEEAKQDERLQGKQNEDGTYNLPDLIDYYYQLNYTEENQNTLPGDEEVYHPYNLSSETFVKDYSTSQEGNLIQEIRTDSKGYLKSPELAYGEYIVLETSVPREQQVVKGFVIKVQEDNRDAQDLRFVIDKDFKTRVKIYTKDARTKNTILNKEAYYVIKNEETGKYMTKIGWNGTKFVEKGTIENPFESKNEGYFITPMDLPIGKYVLEEVTAPNGYVVNGKEGYSNQNEIVWTPKESVKFEVKSNTIYYMDNYLGKYIVVLEQENEESLGTITIKSQGQYLGNVETKEENYKFNYETRAIPNVEYDIFAKEDIYSQDNQNILRYKKDEKVVRVVTDENGQVIIENLPQGKYYIKETLSGDGFALKQELQEVEIAYEGQEIPVIFKTIISEETRQKVNIKVTNIDSQTKETIAGGTYGIYTNEEISYKTKEDTIETIPADTLLVKTQGNENGEIIFNQETNVDLPLGSYYIKEITAPSGYIKTEEKIEIEAKSSSSEEQIDIILTQEKQKTGIKIRNINKESESLLGAKIEIQDENQNVVSTIESLDELNKIEGLETKTTYTLEIINPASGYITNEKIEFYIEEDGTLNIAEDYLDKELNNTIIIVSQKTKLNVTFRDNNQNIRNINFVIKEQGTSNIIASTKDVENLLKIQESEQGYFVEKLPIGNYTLVQEEIPYEEGYTEKQTININIQDTIETQEIIVEQPISKLLIKITDETSKELLNNMAIAILNKDGSIIATTEQKEGILNIKETEKGYLLEKIPIGEYKISEITKDGYKTISTKKVKVEDTKEEQLLELTTRKLIVNIELDKKLENIIVNGQATKANENELMKIEIKERKIATTTLELQYKITIMNKGEVETSIEKIADKIPNGLICEANKNPNWNITNGEAVYKESITLKPNESKELTIIMKWKNSKTNFGEMKNTAQAIGMTNKYNYKNENSTNSTDSSSVVISVGTGLEEKVTIVRIIIICLTACMAICLFAGIEILILKRRQLK